MRLLPPIYLIIPPPPLSPLFPYTTLFRSLVRRQGAAAGGGRRRGGRAQQSVGGGLRRCIVEDHRRGPEAVRRRIDRKRTRLNSSHVEMSYDVFCLEKKMDFRGSSILETTG